MEGLLATRGFAETRKIKTGGTPCGLRLIERKESFGRQRPEASGPGSEIDAGRNQDRLQPSISRTGYGRNHGTGRAEEQLQYSVVRAIGTKG